MNRYAGFLLVNKPQGISSFACIQYLKKIVGKNVKIGHSGTLDPFATGLLIVGIGREATSNFQQLMMLDKEYVATSKLAELTDTLDFTGNFIRADKDIIACSDRIKNSIAMLGNSYIQVPPVYSALKHQGVPLHKLARLGLSTDVEKIAQEKARRVYLHAIELIDLQLPFFTIRAHVSHGTYIRSLSNDIARGIESCATTYRLSRTAIGPFFISNAFDLYTLVTTDDIHRCLIPVDHFLQQITV